jgi:peptide/nickel transport system ATP-binding protein
LVIADEPASALDVSVQAKVLELFGKLQREFGFACLFITHDLAVVDQVAHRVLVMHRGELVEQGLTRDVLTKPIQDYTRRLVGSSPIADPVAQRLRRQ